MPKNLQSIKCLKPYDSKIKNERKETSKKQLGEIKNLKNIRDIVGYNSALGKSMNADDDDDDSVIAQTDVVGFGISLPLFL